MNSRGMKTAALGLSAMAVLGGGVAAAATASADSGTGLLNRHHLGQRLLHTETTYIGKDKAPMTVKAISGSVTNVSATSITVTASDKVAETFAIDADTKVGVIDPNAKPKITVGSMADVKASASVIVSARGPAGTDAPATRIVVRP